MAKAKSPKIVATKLKIGLDEILNRMEVGKSKGREEIVINEDIPYEVYLILLQRKINVYQHQIPETSRYYYTITV